MKIKSFARVKNVTVPENSAIILAGNGKGKSTIANAFCWLMVGKMADGSTPEEKIYNDLLPPEQWEADVSGVYHGMSIIRKSSPLFETSRATGIRTIKTRVNTTLFIDDVEVNQREWAEKLGINEKFLLTATPGYFFSLPWKEQRQLMNEIAIGVDPSLASFDLKKASERVTALKSSQNELKRKQDEKMAVIDSVLDVEVPALSDDQQAAIVNFEALRNSDNTALISEINARNNAMIQAFARKKANIYSTIEKIKSDIEINNSAEFKPSPTYDLIEVPAAPTETKEAPMELSDFKKMHFGNGFIDFPSIPENIKEIERLKAFDYVEHLKSTPAKCPLSSELCPTADLHAEKSIRLKNESDIQRLIDTNKSILSRAYESYIDGIRKKNSKIDGLGAVYNDAVLKNKAIEEKNKEITGSNITNKEWFDITKSKQTKSLELQLELLDAELSGLKEPTPETLPIQTEISEDLKTAYAEATSLLRLIDNANAINENNAKKLVQYNLELDDLRKKFTATYAEIAKVQSEIDNYLEKIEGILCEQFPGEFKINFVFYEQTLKGEYKETFRIFVEDKEFLNTALKIKAGIQLIAGFSSAFKINPIVFVDNAECTSNIKDFGLNLIELRFEEGKEITIIKK